MQSTKRPILSFLRPCSILPALIMLCVIFGFSAQTGEVSGSLSYRISYEIVEFGNSVFHLEKNAQELEQNARSIEVPIRKLAHMAEYFVLTLTVLFPLYVYGMRGVRLFVSAGLLCVLFAASDELHQLFVSERSGSIRDVGIDSIGITAALAVTYFIKKVKTVKPSRK